MNSQSKATTAQRSAHKFSPCLIVATCIFLATLLFFLTWTVFFQKSLVGTWEVSFEDKSDTDNAVTYNLKFNFDPIPKDSEDQTGTVTVNLGNMSYFGNYSLIEGTDGNPQISMYSTLDGSLFINSHLIYSVEGNRLSGMKLQITDVEGSFVPVGSDMNFEMTPSVIEYKIEKIKDAKTDEAILGSWKNEEGVIYTYTFFEDNTFSISSRERLVKGSYSAENGIIKLHYYNSLNQIQEEEVSYEKTDNTTITFNGSTFKKSI